jgi:hypothetical protein
MAHSTATILEILCPRGAAKARRSAGSTNENQRKPAVVPTKPLAKRLAALEGWRHVSTPQGRQGAPLLEHCREPPGVRRADRAAARALPGRPTRRGRGGSSGRFRPAPDRCADAFATAAPPASTTASAPHGARRSRHSPRAGRPAARSRCSPRIVRRRYWIVMWWRSGSAACRCTGHGNGVAAGWRVIYGISLNWMISGRGACQRHGKEPAG